VLYVLVDAMLTCIQPVLNHSQLHSVVFYRACSNVMFSWQKNVWSLFGNGNVHIFVAEEKAAVAKYAKNFLPRLFNVIAPVDTTGSDACRLAALETLKYYLKICDRQV